MLGCLSIPGAIFNKIIGHSLVVGSLKNGETEKVARQHDATQTQEAAPLPPMQSAHIHRTSSSNGLITQADSGLARHERHRANVHRV